MVGVGPRQGFRAGLVAGLATVAVMYVVTAIVGLQPLPELLQQPLLAVLPGPVFGFLIDTLQHAGKVLEEVGLIVLVVLGLGGLGALQAALRPRTGAAGLYVAAVLGWLIVTLLLLPVTGQGLLGLDAGLTQPVVWLALMAVYSIALGWVESLGAGGDVDPERRRLLLVAAGGVSVAVLGVRLVPGWVQAVFHPAGSGIAGFSPDITPAGQFYVVSKNFQDPDVAERDWRLRVDGLAAKPMTLDYAALQGLPAATETVTLECISNVVGGSQISTGVFTGVRLADLVARVEPQANASAVNFTAVDGYTETLPLALVSASPEILVAYELDGAALPPQHGFPARILIPGHYGMKGPKWLDRITLAATQQGGYWEDQGWDRQALVRTMSRIDSPQDGATVRVGAVTVGGVAFAGKRGISMVEVSFDGGAAWRPAELQPPLSPFTWVQWRAAWHPGGQGTATLQVRARDGSGQLQSPGPAASFPAGSAGYHTVRVSVGA